ncbi:hypothetical protein [Streptomyces sp. NPDC055692]|uniref:hypothetical protein n=1 Tax=Streptomyces sp. NPDC055692 TaxID=3155683 RepID=UPI00341F15AE
MPKYEEPESIGNEVAEASGEGPVHPRAEIVVVLAQQGIGRNEISRRTNIPAVSVSRIAEANGIYFDGSRIEPAMKALRTRIAELKEGQAGIALGLHEDIAVARMLLRTARTHRDYAFAAKSISDLTQSAQRMTPEVSDQEEMEEVKGSLAEFFDNMRAVRDGFEAQHGVPFESEEARRIIEQEESENEQP